MDQGRSVRPALSMGSTRCRNPRICNPILGGRRVQREIFAWRILMGTAAGTRKPQEKKTHSAPKNARRGSGVALLQKLGPGLITGASDDDPSGIATYSQVGARFGYGLLWTMILSYPLIAAIQEICARIGRVTGSGLSANLWRYYPKWMLYSVLCLMSLANIFNLGADLGAMGA